MHKHKYTYKNIDRSRLFFLHLQAYIGRVGANKIIYYLYAKTFKIATALKISILNILYGFQYQLEVTVSFNNLIITFFLFIYRHL